MHELSFLINSVLQVVLRKTSSFHVYSLQRGVSMQYPVNKVWVSTFQVFDLIGDSTLLRLLTLHFVIRMVYLKTFCENFRWANWRYNQKVLLHQRYLQFFINSYFNCYQGVERIEEIAFSLVKMQIASGIEFWMNGYLIEIIIKTRASSDGIW